MTYADLDRQARAIGALLQRYGAAGERALLLYPSGLEFIAAFFGCLYSGCVAVPAPPPMPARLRQSLPRMQAIVQDARPVVVLTRASIATIVAQAFTSAPALRDLAWVATDDVGDSLVADWQDQEISSTMLALLQYTSGSTAAPKGVMISHGNLMHNCAYISSGWDYTAESVSATWMPNFHDYGLFEGLVHPVYKGIPAYLISPWSFVQRPIRWLRMIERFKATNSAGPNFAYDLCVRKIKPDECAGLDLSSWRVAGNAAEPVRKATLERFAAAFEPYGFRWSTFYPSYGLAEATLLVSAGGPHAQGPRFCTVQADQVGQEQGLLQGAAQNQIAHGVVGCGQPVCDMRVVIVAPTEMRCCAPGEIGEIWVSDPSVAQGYWNRPDETQQKFQAYLADTGEGPFLRTGDLGLLKDGELFVVGRIKDLIIIDGVNYYPQDIEESAERSHVALRPSCCAAFSIDADDQERLVIVAEVLRHYVIDGSRPVGEGSAASGRRSLDTETVIKALRQAVMETHGLPVGTVVLIRSGNLPMTSSRKIQRHACRAAFLSGALDVIARA